MNKERESQMMDALNAVLVEYFGPGKSVTESLRQIIEMVEESCGVKKTQVGKITHNLEKGITLPPQIEEASE